MSASESKPEYTTNQSKRWQPIWVHIPPNMVSLADYEQAARHYLPHDIQAILFENSLNAKDSNAIALDEAHWLPQVLTSTDIDLNCHLYNPNSAVALDLKLAHPLWLAPVAHQALYHPNAEQETVTAANLLSTPCILSSMGNTPFTHLLPQVDTIRVVQWYWQSLPHKPMRTDTTSRQACYDQRQYNLKLINELIAQGVQLLVITVDAPHSGVRPVSRRIAAHLPRYCQPVNMVKHNNPNLSLTDLLKQAADWQDIEWLVSQCQIPVMLKGILHPQDAQRAQDIGCAGIVVSNHGRRVLADVVPVLKVLPRIREQVGNDMAIIADGGVRSGSDMAKLIACGADAVAIGRGYIYGLALAGALGVAHVNQLLLQELQVTMAVLGVNRLSELTQDKIYQ